MIGQNLAFSVNLADSDEIKFGTGARASLVEMPSPLICNLRLAVARILHVCGAADVFDAFEEEFDDSHFAHGLHFGCDIVSDDFLMDAIVVRTSNLM